MLSLSSCSILWENGSVMYVSLNRGSNGGASSAHSFVKDSENKHNLASAISKYPFFSTV